MSAVEQPQPNEQESQAPDIEDFYWALLFILTEHNQWNSSDAFATANQSLVTELLFRNTLSKANYRAWENRIIAVGEYVTKQLPRSAELKEIVDMHQADRLAEYIRQPGLALNRLHNERDFRKPNGGR